LINAKDKHRWFRLIPDKVMCMQKPTKVMKPNLRSLFQAINGFLETAHMMGETGVHKTRRLKHENLLGKNAMQKGILNVKLTNRPFAIDNKR